MTAAVVYNGGTGALGRHFGSSLADAGMTSHSLASRLGDTAGLSDELDRLTIESGAKLTLIQSAGIVSVARCQNNPAEAFDVNVTRTEATVHGFLQWAADHDITPSIVLVSSGHVYAAPERGRRVTELSPTDPRSVYAETKLEGERVIRTRAAAHGIDLIIGRVFGMLAPDQPPDSLLPRLIERVRSGDLASVPGLDYVRDYLDARDVARHVGTLAARDGRRNHAVVNICSGEETRIGSILNELLALRGQQDSASLEEAAKQVSAAPGRPTDIPWLVGDPSLLSELIAGPIRSIPISDTLAEAVAVNDT